MLNLALKNMGTAVTIVYHTWSDALQGTTGGIITAAHVNCILHGLGL
jgi:hypothetical protein